MRKHFTVVGATMTLMVAFTQVAGGPASAVPPPDNEVRSVAATVETDPVAHGDDAADDPAIWVNPTKPEDSLVIGNDKQGALETYDLNGKRRQRITTSDVFWGNVDVRQGVRLGGQTMDVVAVVNGQKVRIYTVNPTTRMLTRLGEQTMQAGARGQGLCLYNSPQSGLSFFAVDVHGDIHQYTVAKTGSGVSFTLARSWNVVIGEPPREASEGCVADDTTGALYLSEEKVALWRYKAEPDANTSRTQVDTVGADGNLVRDIEGLALTYGSTNYLIASAQYVELARKSYFTVYRRTGNNAYIGAFRVDGSSATDACERTDGIAAYDGYLGPQFPNGIFICQDNNNRAPKAGNQNFKFVPLERILGKRSAG